MIVGTLFRLLWVAFAFCIAVGIALAVLFVLGAVWAGDELRNLAPQDPMMREAAPAFGMVVFAGTVTPALTAFPALLALIAGEALRLRSWMYYVLAGGVALLAIPLLAAGQGGDAALPLAPVTTIFAASGFIGGFVYWLLAGRNA